MLIIFNRFNQLIKNHLRIKINSDAVSKKFIISKIKTISYFRNFPSIYNPNFLLYLFSLKILSNRRPYLNAYKLKYKKVDLSSYLTITEKKIHFLLLNFSNFIFPMVLRRNVFYSIKQNEGKDLIFSDSNFNFLPLIPNKYASHSKVSTFIVQFHKNSFNLLFKCLILSYFNFSFSLRKGKKNEIV